MCDDWTAMNFSTLEDMPMKPGVYFLMNDVELVYVGQSNCIRRRVQNHGTNWNCGLYLGDQPLEEDTFDSIYYLECEYKPERKVYEDMFKDDYSPKLNNFNWKQRLFELMAEHKKELC